jgi:putative glutamine amidotransferase
MRDIKKIGILNNVFDKSTGVSRSYLEYFKQFGKVITIDWDDEEVQDIDLLVLPGGADVSTFRYNQKPDYYTGSPNIYFEWFDQFVLPNYIKQGIPVFGICRGMQTLNVLFGGTLHQNIIQEYSVKTRGEEVHTVTLDKAPYVGNFIKSIGFNFNSFKTNSLHHQAVDEVGSGFQVIYTHAKLDNIEAIYHKELPIIAVQWHPEEMDNDQFSNKAIKFLLNTEFSKVNIHKYEEVLEQ